MTVVELRRLIAGFSPDAQVQFCDPFACNGPAFYDIEMVEDEEGVCVLSQEVEGIHARKRTVAQPQPDTEATLRAEFVAELHDFINKLEGVVVDLREETTKLAGNTQGIPSFAALSDAVRLLRSDIVAKCAEATRAMRDAGAVDASIAPGAAAMAYASVINLIDTMMREQDVH